MSYEFDSQQGPRGISRSLCRNLPEHTLACAIRGCLRRISILTDGHVAIPISLTAILVRVSTQEPISLEIIRTGIEAVPEGQTEAALSLS